MCETVGILKIELFHNNDIVQVMYNDYYSNYSCHHHWKILSEEIKLILFHL